MEKPSYYAILTADVRYDTKLKPLARLLFAEITALCNKEGYCWAGNQYFADLYEVDKTTVSGWIGQLKTRGYLTVQMQYKEGSKQILNRYIKINGEAIDKIINTSPENDLYPIDQKAKVNTTINNTFNNTVNSFDTFWNLYPRKAGKANAKKAWQKLNPDCSVMELIAENIADRLAKGEWTKDKESYILHASTFLNQNRWEDEVLEKQHERPKSIDSAASKWLNLEADY